MDSLLKKNSKYDYELVFINDGSRDDSLKKLLALQTKDKRISVLNFSRNFGHQMAVTAGLDFAKGDAVIIMDSDMQDPPKVSFDLVTQWEKGYQVVYAQRKTRKDGAFKKITASVYYRLLARFSDIDIPRNTGDFRLLDRAVVTELNKFRERNRYIRGLVSFVGFKQTAVQFDREERFAGETGYPLKKMLKFAIDGILGFSNVPLKLISQMGMILSGLSFFGILYAVYVKVFDPSTTVPGWTFIVIAVLLMGGLQLMMLGVLGTYIGRMYAEIQQRPLYIISETFTHRDKSS